MKLFEILLVAAVLAAFSTPASAKLYRWVDEEGKVHYSDKVPPKYSQKQRSRLDERGLEVEKIDRAKSPEEYAKEQELERLRREKERILAEQKAADEQLLRTYRTEDDIHMTRDGKLRAIDSRIEFARSNIKLMQSRLAQMQSDAAGLERRGQQVPENIRAAIESTREHIEEGYRTIHEYEQRKEAVTAKYDEDLRHFQRIANVQASSEEVKAITQGGSKDALLDTLVICEQACEGHWERAQAYVRRHGNTKVQLAGEDILVMSPPRRNDEIGLTVSRLRGERGEHRIFLDLQCKDSLSGQEFCSSETVSAIRRGFKPAVLGEVGQ